MNILVINSGSSTVKLKLFDMQSEEVLFAGNLDGIGTSRSRMVIAGTSEGKAQVVRDVPCATHRAGLGLLTDEMNAGQDGGPPPSGIGHRIVHGGERFVDEPVDGQNREQIRDPLVVPGITLYFGTD